MSNGLTIRKDGDLDFVSIGALVTRLDPGIIPFRKASHCHIHVSGGEFNVAANLSDCFRLKTGVATAMVDYPIGDLVNERVRAMGVKPFYKHVQARWCWRVRTLRRCIAIKDMVFGRRWFSITAPMKRPVLLKPGDFDWKSDISRVG